MALCSPSVSVLPNEPLVRLLQDSISCIQDDAVHPVLYQALSGLHECLGRHQRRLVQVLPPTASPSSWQRPRPSFCKPQDDSDVVAFGWMEESRSHNSENGGVNWTPVILVLMAAGGQDPFLRIVQENARETKTQMPLRSLLVEHETVYGDPRLVLTAADGNMVTLRCPMAATWASEIQAVLQSSIFKPLERNVPMMVNPSVEVSRDENDADIVHDPSEHQEGMEKEAFEEERFYFRDAEHSGEAPFREIEMGFDDEELSEKCEVLDTKSGEWLPIEAFLMSQRQSNKQEEPRTEENSIPPVEPTRTAPPTKQIAEEKLQEMEAIHSKSTVGSKEQEQPSAKKEPHNETPDPQPTKEQLDPPQMPQESVAQSINEEPPQPESQQQQRQQQLQSQMQERLQQPHGQEKLQQQMQQRLQKQKEYPNQRGNEQSPQVPKSIIQHQNPIMAAPPKSTAAQKSKGPEAQPIKQPAQTPPQHPKIPQVPPQQQPTKQHPQGQQQPTKQASPVQRQPPQPQAQQRQQQLQYQMHTRMQQPQGQQHQQMQARLQQQQQQKQIQGGTVPAQRASTPPKQPTPPPAPTTQIGKEMRVEQQKKLAQERRKQDLESQRKLAREEQKRKDLEAKRKFLQKEQRKQELVAKNQTRTSNNDASANLRQINQQMAEIDAEILQVQSRADAIKAEIEQRKNQPLQMPPTGQQPQQQSKGAAAAAAQRRLEEQARREQTLAAQKKAEFQKRQKELEEQRRKAREEQKRKEEMQKRRLLEHEKRKQDLMAKAKAGKAQAKDSALLQKLSHQISGLDMEAKQRAEEAKEEEEGKETAEDQHNEEVDDPEAARKRIAEEARQRELEEEMKRPSPVSEKAKSPNIHLATSASSEEGGVGGGWGQQAKAPKINLATSASSEEGGVGGGWGQQAQQATFTPSGQQPHQAAYTPSSSSHADPFGHLQVPGQHAQCHQPAMQTHGVPPYQYSQQFSHNTASASPPQYYYPTGVQQHPPHLHHHHAPHGQHQQPGYQKHIPPYHQNRSPPHQQSHAQTPLVQPGFPHPSSSHRRPPQPSPPAPRPTPPRPPHPSSGTNHNQKYAVTQNSEDDDDQSALTDLKKKIIAGWALQPPEMQGLRPINELLCTIQTVIPPANNLPPHTYFEGWKVVSDTDLRDGQAMDEKKLSKAVRKLRFFLHPDKLPRDLTDEQQFVCTLLWDITNDAFADYKKALEDLDWMNN